jgi:MarR family transcriptional repressor of emrRAB
MEPYLRQMRTAGRGRSALDVTEAGLLLLFLSDDAMRLVARRLEPFGISEKKLDVLLLFTGNESAKHPTDAPTPTSIADYMNVTRASATGLLDWLEGRGLIGRKDHPTDRRSVQTEITAKGRELVAKVLPTFRQACEDLAAGLDDRDRTDLKRVLSKMWNYIKHIDAE